MLIPFVALGGAIPGAIGGGSAAACVLAASHPELSLGVRLMLCVAITTVAWGAFVAMIGGVAAIGR